MIKKCTKCGEEKPIENFSPSKRGNKVYRNSQCTYCRTKYNRNKYYGGRKAVKAEKTESHRECINCLGMFEYSECSGSYCKACWKYLFYDKEKAKQFTKEYRERHKERWKAMHRVHQYNRKALIKASEDGTVTDSFLKELLAKEFCCWCRKYTEKKQRTLEHLIELSNGGEHSASNLDMACFSCNSSRFNRDVKK